MSLSQVSSIGRAKDKNEDAVMTWSHIQLVMSGKRIISAPIAIAGKKWSSTAAFRRHQFIDGVDLGIEQSEVPLGIGAPCSGLPQQYGFIEGGSVGATSLLSLHTSCLAKQRRPARARSVEISG